MFVCEDQSGEIEKKRRVKLFMSFCEMIERDISKEHFGEE